MFWGLSCNRPVSKAMIRDRPSITQASDSAIAFLGEGQPFAIYPLSFTVKIACWSRISAKRSP
jgi:hypothetical protein